MRECGFVGMRSLTHTSRMQFTRNITSDYISRLLHRSVPGRSLSPFSSSAFLLILYHFRERGPGYEAREKSLVKNDNIPGPEAGI